MGCRVCRARKVKCDERPNGCANCQRLGLDCIGLSNSSPSSVSVGDDDSPGFPAAARPARTRRTYRSCGSCRASKTKCDGQRPRCFRCRTRSTQCIYSAGPEPRWALHLSKAPTASPQAAPAMVSESPEAAETTEPHDEAAVGSPVTMREEANAPPKLDSLLTSSSTVPLSDNEVLITPSTRECVNSDPLSWLLSPELPTEKALLRELVEQYFNNVHHLRCFAFVHKPSFMRQLDQGQDRNREEDALLYMICAQGAKFYALEHGRSRESVPTSLIHSAGNEWARAAERLIFANYGKVSVSNLMATVLLYDFQFRVGGYTQALMLSGLVTRMAHALQLNLECTPDTKTGLSVLWCETRRRLMWACYVLDAWTGSGVDQLTLLREDDIEIQLPCDEPDFLLQRPCTTSKLQDRYTSLDMSSQHTGLMSSYIHLVATWKRIVRYVKHLDEAQPPWQAGSEFASLRAALQSWRAGLSVACLDFSLDSIYIRLESSQLGALALLHCTYHNAMCDLYRISMPELFKLPALIPSEQAGFLEDLQTESFYHAQDMAIVLAEAASRGARFLADSALPTYTYNSSRVMLYYLARLIDLSRPTARMMVEDTIRHVQSNTKVLRMMSVTIPLAQPLCIALDRWLRKVITSFNRVDMTAHIGPQDPSDVNETRWSEAASGSVMQSKPDDVLNPLSLYRLARKAVKEGDASEHLAGSLRSGEAGSTLSESSVQSQTTPQRDIGSGNRSGSAGPWAQFSADAMAAGAQPLGGTGLTLEPVLSENSMVGEQVALDLSDLQFYPPWDLEGLVDPGDTRMDESGQAAWLRFGDRTEVQRASD